MARLSGGTANAAGGIHVPGVYAQLLSVERQRDSRYPRPDGQGGVFRRPRHLLDALEAGETVTVPSWRLAGHSVPGDDSGRLREYLLRQRISAGSYQHCCSVSPDDSVRCEETRAAVT